MVKLTVLKESLSAILNLHQWHLWVLVTVMDRKEHKFLDSHRFCTLYESNFAFPIYLYEQKGSAKLKILRTMQKKIKCLYKLGHKQVSHTYKLK